MIPGFLHGFSSVPKSISYSYMETLLTVPTASTSSRFASPAGALKKKQSQ